MTPPFQILTRLRPQSVVALLLILTLPLQVQAQEDDARPRTVTIRRGQILALALVTPLDSRHAKRGDEVVWGLMMPLIADGVTVLPVDSLVRGRIGTVERAAKNCRNGVVGWKFSPLEMADGKKVKIEYANVSSAELMLSQGGAQPIPDPTANPNIGPTTQPNTSPQTTENTTPKAVPKTKHSGRDIATSIALFPLVVLALPILIVTMAGDGGCPDRAIMGRDQITPAGTLFGAEVSHDVQDVIF